MIEKINIKQLRFTCDKCGYIWSKVPWADQKQIPKMCPNCKTYKWNDGIVKITGDIEVKVNLDNKK